MRTNAIDKVKIKLKDTFNRTDINQIIIIKK